MDKTRLFALYGSPDNALTALDDLTNDGVGVDAVTLAEEIARTQASPVNREFMPPPASPVSAG